MLVPKPPEPYILDSDSESEEVPPEDTGSSMNVDPDFLICDTSEPHLITQAELNDFVWDLDPPKGVSQMEKRHSGKWNPNYVGWPPPGSYKGDTNWWI